MITPAWKQKNSFKKYRKIKFKPQFKWFEDYLYKTIIYYCFVFIKDHFVAHDA